jgi:hypothetical protein
LLQEESAAGFRGENNLKGKNRPDFGWKFKKNRMCALAKSRKHFQLNTRAEFHLPQNAVHSKLHSMNAIAMMMSCPRLQFSAR